MEVEHDVKPFRAQAPRQAEVVANALPSAGARDDDDVSEVRVASDDRSGVALHEVGQAGFRKRPLERPEKRRREDHVADETQADEEYLHVSAACPHVARIGRTRPRATRWPR